MLTVAQPRLLTVRETALQLRVSEDTVRRRIASGEFAAVQLGGKGTSVRVNEHELARWLYEHLTSPLTHVVAPAESRTSPEADSHSGSGASAWLGGSSTEAP